MAKPEAEYPEDLGTDGRMLIEILTNRMGRKG